MYNPFPLLTPDLLQEKLAAGKRWFVRQTYLRGKTASQVRMAFLLRAYNETEEKMAREHLSNLKNDAYAHLYDAHDSGENQKLFIAATQPSGYQIYYAGTLHKDWQPPAEYRDRIRNYIRTYHPGWKPKSKSEAIRAGLHEQHGMLFLKLSFKEEEEIIPFELIEKT